MSRFDADDPRFTAYALGELDDADERATVETICDRDPEARACVAGVRETAALLTAELSGAPGIELSDLQRKAIRDAGATPSVKPSRRGLWIAGGAALAAAAAGIVMVVATPMGAKRAPTGSSAETLDRTVAVSSSPDPVATPVAGDDGYMAGSDTSTADNKLADHPAGVLGALRGGSGTGRGYGDITGSADFSTGIDGDGRFAVNLPNREAYAHTKDNDFVDVSEDPRSTFSIDVDTGSYSNIRRMLRTRQLPPADAVRIEEMINYFEYDYPAPATEHPFSLSAEVGRAPWNRENLLVKIGVQGKAIEQQVRPRSNLVFLVDVSGSMAQANKLPLLKRSVRLLVDSLDAEDRVAIVVYAGAAGQVLPSTPVRDRRKILRALDRLEAGGSTNGGAGIELAYRIAARHFVQGGINRVLLATDGDFNVGVSHTGGLVRLVEEKAKSGVFLTVLGFGMGNYNDAMLEEISNKGNGHYAYIDTLNEARKVLVHELDSTLVTIAKDVKIQIELNPREVARYRLIGYANRILAHRDFTDDAVDAGEIGAGHSVTALYELVPARPAATGAGGLKYQTDRVLTAAADAGELMNVKLRYKRPDGDTSRLVEAAIGASVAERPSADFQLASGVAAFGMLLRDSEHKGDASYGQVVKLIEGGLGRDRFGYRRELLELVRIARSLDRR